VFLYLNRVFPAKYLLKNVPIWILVREQGRSFIVLPFGSSNIKIQAMETTGINLAEKKCIPCEGDMQPLEQNEIRDLEKHISADWKILENKKIFREFSFVNYKHTMDFVNKVAELAEQEGHHPVMHVYYGRIEIELWTHAIDGLSENDFILAAKIERL
jgi:4a-hydroxytetrahydrobiopterin dehydratase